MALVKYNDGVTVPVGHLLGTAFGNSNSGSTLFRSPLATNRITTTQETRRNRWREAQRYYKELPGSDLALLSECGSNNPHVNARGEVVFANRYHKWLQLAVYEPSQLQPALRVINTDASPGLDYPVVSVQAFGVPPDFFNSPYLYLLGNAIYSGGFNPVFKVFAYTSRPVTAGQQVWNRPWVLVGSAEISSNVFEVELSDTISSPFFYPGDELILKFEIIDVTRAFVVTQQLERVIVSSF